MSILTRKPWDAYAGVVSVALLGCGAFVTFAAGLASDVTAAVAGGVLLSLAFLILMAANRVSALLLLVISLPLPAVYSSDAARVAPVLLLSTILLIAWLVARGADRRPIAWHALPLPLALALFTAIATAAAFATQPINALRELVNWVVLLGFLIVAVEELVHAPQRVRTVALTIAVVGALSGVVAVLETVGVLPARFIRSNTTLNRAALGFGWPNEAGMFLALSLPFTVYACEQARTSSAKLGAGLGLACCVVGLFATFSRGSWLAVLAASFILLFVGERRFVLRVWMLALLTGFVLDAISGGAIRERIASTLGDWVLEQRIALTLAGLIMFRAHLLVGVGPGGFAESLEQYGPGITWLWDYLPTAQNAYVQMAAETGLIGLVALLIFLGVILYRLQRGVRTARRSEALTHQSGLRRALLWAFAIACALGLGEWTFAHGIGQLVMLIPAMGYALDHQAAGRA